MNLLSASERNKGVIRNTYLAFPKYFAEKPSIVTQISGWILAFQLYGYCLKRAD